MRPQNTKHYYRALRIDLFLGVLTPIINFIAERKDHKQSTLKTYFIIMKTIKFLSLLMLVALSAGFASCSDDEDFEAADLVGTWEATHTEGWYKDSQYPDKDETWNGSGKDELGESFLPSKLQFNADRTGVDIYVYDDDENFEWAIKGSDLAITYSDARTVIVKIVDLTENKAVVEFSFNKGVESLYEKVTYTRVK